MKDLFSLEGKVAIVTGGNGGIGKAIARGLASRGASIVIAARNESKTAEAAREIKEESGVPVLAVQIDLLQEAQITPMVTKILDTFGEINILVNNAGINIRKMPQELTTPEWDAVINTNLRSPFWCSQAIYPALKAAGGGKIINIGSMMSLFGGVLMAPYGASKGGIVQLTRSLAVAWAPDNIQVNAILPGWFKTEIGRQWRESDPNIEHRITSRTPAGRWGEIHELAGASIFLASPASDFVTGIALPVDGGYSIGGDSTT